MSFKRISVLVCLINTISHSGAHNYEASVIGLAVFVVDKAVLAAPSAEAALTIGAELCGIKA